jgi:hypothetical protein
MNDRSILEGLLAVSEAASLSLNEQMRELIELSTQIAASVGVFPTRSPYRNWLYV